MPPTATTAAANNLHLGIIGLGLIGGSLALAAKRAGWQVSAYNRTAASSTAAVNDGYIDCCVNRIGDLGNCDVIFLGVPVSTYDEILAELQPVLSPRSIVTDGGSTKQDGIAAAKRQLGDLACRFVAAHPIAGKEASGWTAASADLFVNHLTILCPNGADEDAIATVTMLWQQAGAQIHTMSAELHDTNLAMISHLPHLLAYALVSMIDKQEENAKLLQFAAGGFRDFTRIASSHPEMWRDICLANADNLLPMIECYQQELAEFADYIKNQDSQALSTRFAAARSLRQQWLNTLKDNETI